MKKQFRTTIFAAFLLAAAAMAQQQTASAERVLHFGSGEALGLLSIEDAKVKSEIKDFHHWVTTGEWETLGPAKGDVVIPAGKKVRLTIYSADKKNLLPLGLLPPDALYMLVLYGHYETPGVISTKELEAICKLKGLRELKFWDLGVSNGALRHLERLTNLERLTTPRNINDAGFRNVCQIRNLKGLYLRKNTITDKGLEYLENLAELEELNLGGEKLTDESVRFAVRLPRLKHLELWGDFHDGCTAYLKDMPSLKTFAPFRIKTITDASLPDIAKCRQLEKLTLYDASVTDAGLVHLTGLTSLKVLNLGSWGPREVPITDASMVHVGKITTLEHLSTGSGVTDRGIAHLANLKELRSLNGVDISSDETLEYIGRFKNLEGLSIRGTGLTDRGLDYVAGLSNLRSLGLYAAPNITNAGIAKLGALKELKWLNMDVENVSISGISRLSLLSKLKSLVVRNIVQDNSVLDISGLRKLETLRIQLKRRTGGDYEPLRDEDFKCLGNLQNLSEIQASASEEVTDAALAYLAPLTNMRFLNLGGAGITDEGLRHLSGMKRLHTLRLNRANITGAGLKYLYGLESLRTVYIRCEDACSRPAIELLKRARPDLEMVDISPIDNSR